jgi:hypothetical protein
MAVIKIGHEVTVDGVSLTGSSRLNLTTLSDITSVDFCVQNISVAATNTSQVLWASGNGVTTFLRGLIITDQDIVVELRTDNATAEFPLFFIDANVPFWFTQDAAGDTTESLDGAALVEGTDYDQIDRIECQNEGSSAATVSLYLFN